MKLKELSEAEVTADVLAKYLVLYVDGAMGGYYIITDIPPISEQKFQKLYDLSFESGSLAEWIEITRIRHKDWYEHVMFLGGTSDVPTWVYTWKAFVATMKEHFPFDTVDDFDE